MNRLTVVVLLSVVAITFLEFKVMKINYLALISRTEFNSLFKYGRLLLNSNLMIYGKSEVETLNNLKEKIGKVDFDNTFSHLIIQYEKDDQFCYNKNNVIIQEVKHVYALDNDAKREFEISFDERIKIEEPLFDVSEIFVQKTFEDCKRGIENVWQVFGFADEEKTKCQRIITDEILRNTVNLMLSDNKALGDYPLWVYLMRYERHSYYPKETVGYFMDAVHIFCNYKKSDHQALDNEVESTGIYKLLSAINVPENTNTIYQQIENSDFCKALNSLEPSCNFLKIAVIYLKIKDEYREGLKYDKSFIDLCKEHFKEDFVVASYLLGIYLGYDKTYDCLYDVVKLPIFKSAEEMSQLQAQKELARRIAEEKMKEPESVNTRNNTPTLFGSTETSKTKSRSKKTKKNGK